MKTNRSNKTTGTVKLHLTYTLRYFMFLFRSQMTSKSGKNISDPLVCSCHILTSSVESSRAVDVMHDCASIENLHFDNRSKRVIFLSLSRGAF